VSQVRQRQLLRNSSRNHCGNRVANATRFFAPKPRCQSSTATNCRGNSKCDECAYRRRPSRRPRRRPRVGVARFACVHVHAIHTTVQSEGSSPLFRTFSSSSNIALISSGAASRAFKSLLHFRVPLRRIRRLSISRRGSQDASDTGAKTLRAAERSSAFSLTLERDPRATPRASVSDPRNRAPA
jgi:hypothetical protein